MFPTTSRILIVDDFSTIRRIIKSSLTQMGYSNFKEADDGSTAWSILQNETFDLIITDWNMPQVTGLELLKRIRMSDRLQNIPVLMVTAEAKREQIIEAAQAGVNGYIVKPFTMETLKSKIGVIYNRISDG